MSKSTKSSRSNHWYYNQKNDPFIIAHRGSACSVPENTLPAFSLAINENCDFVEMDTLLTKDNQIVIFHDPCLTHITDIFECFGEEKYEALKESRFIDFLNKEISDVFTDKLTLDEIKQLGVKQKLGRNGMRSKIFDSQFKIPTFKETIQLFIDENKQRKELLGEEARMTGICLEVKQCEMYRKLYGQEFNFAEMVRKELEDMDVISGENPYCPIIISSFDQSSVKYFAENTNLPCHQLINHIYPWTLDSVESYANGVSIPLNYIFKPTANDFSIDLTYIKEAKAKGLQVWVYTIRDDDTIFTKNSVALYYALRVICQVQGIFTEFPTSARECLQCFSVFHIQGFKFEEINTQENATAQQKNDIFDKNPTLDPFKLGI